MTKQEFLAFSLAYDLKISFYDDYRDCNIVEKINEMHVDVYSIMSDTYDGNPDKCKILLRPLSDLTKEIEHNGEKFVPIDELNNIGDAECDRYNDYFNEENISDVNWSLEPFIIFQKLIEWKFDIADLISKGEAIDVNTLEINPYK